MSKKIEAYTVRNSSGQYLGTYRALSAQAAIQKHKDGQLALASTFRKSFHYREDTYTAKVELQK